MPKHAILKRLEPQILGRDLHLHFVYDSADAAGQNMTTGCTWRACHWIMAEIGSAFGLKVERFIIESNLSSDKKVTFNNFYGWPRHEGGGRMPAAGRGDPAVPPRDPGAAGPRLSQPRAPAAWRAA